MPTNPSSKAQRVEDRPDEYLSGVPNRDLTEEDWIALDPEQQRLVAECGLWNVKLSKAEKADLAEPAEAEAPAEAAEPVAEGDN